MTNIMIAKERCKGCSLCIKVCPKKILGLSNDLNNAGMHPVDVIDMNQCIGCCMCAVMCPDVAIRIERS